MTNQARGSLPGKTAAKLFKMAKHCLERAEEMYDTTQEEGRVFAGNEPATGPASCTPTPIPMQSAMQQYQQQRYMYMYMYIVAQ